MEQLTAQRKEDGDRIRALQRQLAEKDEELHEANQHMKASAGSVQTEIKRYSDEVPLSLSCFCVPHAHFSWAVAIAPR